LPATRYKDRQVSVNGASAPRSLLVLVQAPLLGLGKLGRVEVLPKSTIKLSFDDSSMSVAMLEAGRVRLSSSSNVASSAKTVRRN
jgi:hypothetical protein